MVNPREGMAATISYWQEKKRKSLDGPTIFAWFFCIIGMSLLFYAAFMPPFWPLEWVRSVALFLHRSLTGVRVAFILAAAAHVVEAVYAWHLSKRVDPGNSRGWFWQTLALGIFSLRFLLKRAKSWDKFILYYLIEVEKLRWYPTSPQWNNVARLYVSLCAAAWCAMVSFACRLALGGTTHMRPTFGSTSRVWSLESKQIS